jgi:RNA polymerase sigma factor (sigma-70 family)
MTTRTQPDPPQDQQIAPDDREILRLLRNPQPSCYEDGVRLLLEHHGGRVADALRHRYRDLLSEDEVWECIYDASYKAWRSADSFDPEKGTLGGWLYRIAQRAAIDVLAGRHQEPMQSLSNYDPPDALGSDSDSDEGEPTVAKERLLGMLAQAIDELPPLQRSVIRADLAAGTEADEDRLAQLYDTSRNSIRVSRYKAHHNLRKWFRERGLEPDDLH